MIFEVGDAPALVEALSREGWSCRRSGPRRVRAVTHLDVDAAGVDRRARGGRGGGAPAGSSAECDRAMARRIAYRHVPALRGHLRPARSRSTDGAVTRHPRRRRRRPQPRLRLPQGRRAAASSTRTPTACARRCVREPGGDFAPGLVGRGLRGDRPPPARHPGRATAATRWPPTSATRRAHNLELAALRPRAAQGAADRATSTQRQHRRPDTPSRWPRR